jgi:hypothetical protein
VISVNDVAARRARLTEIERELAGLRSTHDLAMSAFKFDEANALQRRIVALEDERQSVIVHLPGASLSTGPETGVVPILARPRRVRRRR